jgi:molecular chaperone GrpE
MPEELEDQRPSAEPEEVDGAGIESEFSDRSTDPLVLAETVLTLTRERDELKDRLLRQQAEFENFKKRIDRERSDFVQFASAELMREVLNVLDSFELALRNVQGDGSSPKSGDGFELIYKQLISSLKRFGLEPLEARGRKFDPHFHEAVSMQPTGDAEEGTVLEDLRKGYLLNGKLLRPSMVTVATVAVAESGGEADS